MERPIFVLDSGFVWTIVNPRAGEHRRQRLRWMIGVAAKGVQFVLPAIVDYEVRRELRRRSADRMVRELDALRNRITYWQLSDPALRRAAELWARARQQGRSTADDQHLDIDVILAAQTQEIGDALAGSDDPVIVTENVRHLSWFCQAKRWDELIDI